MANSKSAEKRIRTHERNRRQNRYYKTSVQTLRKKFLSKIELYKNSNEPINREELEKILSLIYSILDKGTKRNVFHKNTTARQKTRLSKKLQLL